MVRSQDLPSKSPLQLEQTLPKFYSKQTSSAQVSSARFSNHPSTSQELVQVTASYSQVSIIIIFAVRTIIFAGRSFAGKIIIFVGKFITFAGKITVFASGSSDTMQFSKVIVYVNCFKTLQMRGKISF